MPIRALNVAEKPSVAKEVSRVLSEGRARSHRGPAQYNPIWEFPYNINGQPIDMVFSSVAGHLMEVDFADQYRKWGACNPMELYRLPVLKKVPADKQQLKKQLEQLARQAQWLVLWLDCDREGENISFEVMEVCLAVNPRLYVRRARFSALIARELHAACANLGTPNQLDAMAVDARQEIDLRVGASFTRFMTMLLRHKFDWRSGGVEGDKLMLSYGPCQFPTLGLIVQRAWEIQSHVAEPFWHLHVSWAEPPPSKARCDFEWLRGRLFCHQVAALLYEACLEAPVARVVSVRGHERRRYAPPPLSTLEMQKKATQYLRLPGERIMKLAEELYQAGFISYPRTETDEFSPNQDLMTLVQDQTQDGRWGSHARAIASGAMWKQPKGGGHDDKAHPPIHPVKYTSGEANWPPEKHRLYEFIVRSFLAACSKDAVGYETQVTIDIAGEGFRTTGLMVTERNWLEVYPWANWGGNSNLPSFSEGATFSPTDLTLKQGTTQPPPRMSERDLIGKMEANGIGTDATVAEHIQKQLDRGYAEKDEAMAFWPTRLGEALISGYRAMGLDGLWKPDLRAKIEAQIHAVARGAVHKEQVLANAIDAFRDDFMAATQRCRALEGEGGQVVGPCGRCGEALLVSQLGDGSWCLACSQAGPGRCRRLLLPRAVLAVAGGEGEAGLRLDVPHMARAGGGSSSSSTCRGGEEGNQLASLSWLQASPMASLASSATNPATGRETAPTRSVRTVNTR